MTRLIVFDATPYGPEPSGARRRAVALLRRLPGLMPDDVFEVHWARDGGGPPDELEAPNLVHATVEVSCRGGARRWRRRGRDLERRHAGAPYSHLLTDHGPVVRPDVVRNLVTVHDLRFLHGYGGVARALYGRFAYGRQLRRAGAVVAVSDAVRSELRTFYGLPAERLHAVPNAVSQAFVPPADDRRAGALLVARDEPRKARAAAESAARAAGVALRVVDDVGADDQLRDCYASASWLLAPSLLEGFNLPIVEALACGTPVIASDIPAHSELAERGARGLILVPAPVRVGGDLVWPEATRALAAPPPTDVSPPAWTWDDAAQALAGVLSASD